MDMMPPAPRSEEDRAKFARIADQGWVATHAEGAGEQPPFSYTTGLSSKLGAPELIVFGLPDASAELLFTTYVRELDMGGLITSGRAYRTFLDGLSVQFLDLDPADDRLRKTYMPWTFWYYRDVEIPVMQLVWPDAENRLPWDQAFDERLHAYQPILGVPPSDEA